MVAEQGRSGVVLDWALWEARWVGVVVVLLREWDSVLQELERVVVVEVVLRGLRFGCCRWEEEGLKAEVGDFGRLVGVVRLVEGVARMLERD